jgi:ketosteroid isomerase-like protein
MSTTEANESAVRACFANASRGNFDALRDIVAADYVVHPDGARGPDGLAEMVQGYRDKLGDLTVTIEHQFSVEDYVATRSTIRGDGVELTCLTISRCRDGKIEEEWELVG